MTSQAEAHLLIALRPDDIQSSLGYESSTMSSASVRSGNVAFLTGVVNGRERVRGEQRSAHCGPSTLHMPSTRALKGFVKSQPGTNVVANCSMVSPCPARQAFGPPWSAPIVLAPRASLIVVEYPDIVNHYLDLALGQQRTRVGAEK